MKNDLLHVATYEETCKHLQPILDPKGKKIVIRMGGNMPYANYPIQINSVEAIKTSTDKLKMKLIFIQNGIPTSQIGNVNNFPVVVKGIKRSQGSGVFICKDEKELAAAIKKVEEKNNGFYLEQYFPAMREFRLHVSKWEGVFFEVEKKRNDGHYGELGVIKYENHYNVRQFIRPANWEAIRQSAVAALKAQGLDIAAYDIGLDAQGNYAFYESNTGPELLKNTLEEYRKTLQKYIDSL